MAMVLRGLHILVLDDEYLAAIEMGEAVKDLGGTVVGPIGRLDEALALAESRELDGAILDLNLNGRNSFPVADALAARHIPIVFVTGYDTPMLPERFLSTPRMGKPLSGKAIEKALTKAFTGT